MKKHLLIILIAFQFTLSASGQGNKSVFLEIGANGIGFSANYDARFSKKENGFGFRGGVGFFPGSGNNGVFEYSTIFTVPFGVNYLAGKGPHHFEAGLGGTYVSGSFNLFDSDDAKSSGVIFIPSVGYRYAAKTKGFQGRIVISPLIGSGGTAVYGGISFGYKW